MSREKRIRQAPIPTNYMDLLNDDQKRTMQKMEQFGWELKFVRRPLFQVPTAVMVDPSGAVYGVLEENGDLNRNYDIVIRD